MALKKASNKEVFTHVKLKFDEGLKQELFHENNVLENFTSKRRLFSPLDTSTDKLRRKYANLKLKWKELDDRVSRGTGLAPEEEPGWYRYLNPVFSDTNEEINLTSNSNDLSYNGH